MSKKHRKGTASDKLKIYLVLGSLLTTWLAGDLLAQREEVVTAVSTNTPVLMGEIRGAVPQIVARSRSSR